MGTSPEKVMEEFKKHQEFAKIKDLTSDKKLATDTAAWTAWVQQYRTRVQKLAAEGVDLTKLNEERALMIKSNSPKYVLRNYLAQNAIAKAEAGDYTEVNALLQRLHDPYLFLT